ncbi:hypothetical protein BDZ91DRAFT_718810 [Kalaharituber pfeilii]|nr:hypothetical protein BDZ91DRAFT_718810 [Kalaharituber pfeilii]
MSADDAPLSYFTIAPGEKIGLPVICLCVEGAECGCDETDDPGYAEGVLQDVVNSEGRGPIARINVVNGELTLVVNGTVRSETSGTRRIQRDASMWHAVLGVVVVGGMYMAGFA